MDNLHLAGNVDVVHDGEAVMDYLAGLPSTPEARPAVVILDLKMPKLGGLEVLRLIRSDPALNPLPVVFFTSSMQERDLLDSAAGGVNSYVVKPLDLGNFMDTVQAMGAQWLLGAGG
jgi:CheY-like chemotaxis protein